MEGREGGREKGRREGEKEGRKQAGILRPLVRLPLQKRKWPALRAAPLGTLGTVPGVGCSGHRAEPSPSHVPPARKASNSGGAGSAVPWGRGHRPRQGERSAVCVGPRCTRAHVLRNCCHHTRLSSFSIIHQREPGHPAKA